MSYRDAVVINNGLPNGCAVFHEEGAFRQFDEINFIHRNGHSFVTSHVSNVLERCSRGSRAPPQLGAAGRSQLRTRGLYPGRPGPCPQSTTPTG
eukprot:5189863-Pleurochrysis_carterae.AAC.3